MSGRSCRCRCGAAASMCHAAMSMLAPGAAGNVLVYTSLIDDPLLLESVSVLVVWCGRRAMQVGAWASALEHSPPALGIHCIGAAAARAGCARSGEAWSPRVRQLYVGRPLGNCSGECRPRIWYVRYSCLIAFGVSHYLMLCINTFGKPSVKLHTSPHHACIRTVGCNSRTSGSGLNHGPPR